MMSYSCAIHGDFDPNKAWGCPDCMREARIKISRLESDLKRMTEIAAEAMKQAGNWREFPK
jgi:hypothetical protein